MKAELSPEQLKWIKEKNYYNFKEPPKEWLESNEFMMQTLTKYGPLLQFASDKLKDDKEIVLVAVTNDGSALEYASTKLKDDKEIVRFAILKSHHLYETADERVIKYASKELQQDKDLKALYEILTEVKDNGLNLKNASDEFIDNKDVVLAAVKQNGLALEFASKKLQADKEVVKVAICSNPEAIEFASSELQNDKKFLLDVLAKNGWVLEYLSDEFKKDKEIVLVAVAKDGQALRYAPDKLKDDKEIVLAAVTNHCYALEYASEKLKDDKEIVLVAVAKNGQALRYASDKLKDDKEILLAAVANDSSSLRFASEEAREYINKKLMEENEIKIGDQTWITKNLDVDTYRNGDVIPEVEDDWEWEDCCSSKTGAWCYYENEYNGTGKLYNWYAVNDPRGLAPKGYHIPSKEEWSILIDNIGDDNYPFSTATKMKSTAGWNNIRNGSNSSGFAGLPGGRRFCSGTFYGGGEESNWWISTGSEGGSEAMNIRLDNDNGYSWSDKGDGLSVRCLRD